MPFEAGSLEDVEAWAEHEFPASFAAIAAFAVSRCIATYPFDGAYVNGRIFQQPVVVSALHVGVTTAGQTVYARITGNDDVELFSKHTFKSPKHTETKLWYIEPVVDLNGIDLAAPFRYPVETGHPAGVDRLEALIRYFYLKDDEKAACDRS